MANKHENYSSSLLIREVETKANAKSYLVTRLVKISYSKSCCFDSVVPIVHWLQKYKLVQAF